MEHWHKGGLSQEEFVRMREEAMRRLQDLAKRQAPKTEKPPVPAQTDKAKHSLPKQETLSVSQATIPPKTADTFGQESAKKVENLSTVPSTEKEEDKAPSLQREQHMSFPKGQPDFEKSPSSPTPEPDQNPAEAERAYSLSVPASAPSIETMEKPSDDFMPSENLLQTIQNISQTMANTENPLAEPSAVLPPDKKVKAPEPAPSASIFDPPSKRTSSMEPPFIPPHPPYHPDGFIPGKTERKPVFHPDAVQPEKGYYLPPQPPQRPPYRQERWQKDGNFKKK